MRVVILKDETAVSHRAADLLCGAVAKNPATVLGLATGGTPLGTYKEMVSRVERGEANFSECTTFNLDEYVGLEPGHSQSYRTFMESNLFAPAGFNLDICHLPPSSAKNLSVACSEYESSIEAAGGIEIQLLGIGTDGHIAFNEPSSSLASRTRVKALTEQTRKDNARFFDSIEQVPKLAITMGIGTILDASEIVLLATGASKASAVCAFIEGPISAQVPASALQLHPRVTVLLDEAAAGWLTRRSYYQQVEAIQEKLEQGDFDPNLI